MTSHPSSDLLDTKSPAATAPTAQPPSLVAVPPSVRLWAALPSAHAALDLAVDRDARAGGDWRTAITLVGAPEATTSPGESGGAA